MYVKDVKVQNQVGLHARPATFFIQKANEFKSSIWIEKEERRVNAKSLLGILSLGIVGGTTIRIIADGSDEQLAVDGLGRVACIWLPVHVEVDGSTLESIRNLLTYKYVLVLWQKRCLYVDVTPLGVECPDFYCELSGL